LVIIVSYLAIISDYQIAYCLIKSRTKTAGKKRKITEVPVLRAFAIGFFYGQKQEWTPMDGMDKDRHSV